MKQIFYVLRGKLAKSVILLVVAVVVWSALALPKLKFSFDLERFFPDGDEDLEFYVDFRDRFSPDNDFVLIGISSNVGIFQKDFMIKLAEFTKELEDLHNVNSVVSPSNIRNLIIGPLGPIYIPYLHTESAVKLKKDSLRIFKEDKLLDMLFSRDGKSVCINLITEKSLSKVKSDNLLTDVNGLLDKYHFDEVHLGGRIPSQAYVINKMGTELTLFMSISFIILLLILYWLYRSFLGVFLPMIIVVFSTIILLGVLVVIDEDINLVITILPVVMFVVGTSDVIHVLSRYSSEKVRSNSWYDALKITFREVGLATLLTSITTSVGFATLMTATIYPVQRFGMVMAIGVMIAFVVTFLLLPSILYLIKDRWKIMKGNEGEEIVRFSLPISWFDSILNNYKVVLITVLGILILSFVGINKLKVNNYLLDDLRDNDPHMVDFKFFENEFSGVRPFELALTSDLGLMDFKVQRELNKLERYLSSEFGAKNIMSPLFFAKSINQALNGGQASEFKLTDNEKNFIRQKKYLKRFQKKDIYNFYVSNDTKEGRVSAKIKDEGRIIVKAKTEALEHFISENINSSVLQVRPTGTALLIDKNAEHLANNMLQGLGIAFIVISIIVAFLFRSFKMVLISLVPNILPLLMIAGVMGLVGIDLKASTIIIFTISFGIAVDDSIHFLSKLKLELGKGKDVYEALSSAYLSTGKAIVVTSLILFAGFASLMFSTFQSTFYIGLLISLTLFFAVLSDLILLPVIVKMFYKKS